MKSKNNLCGTLCLSSGMNSACPKAKGRRKVKKSSWKKFVQIINHQSHLRFIVFGSKVLKNKCGLQTVYRGYMELTYIQQITKPVNRL